MKKTQSEIFFEKYCANSGLLVERITEDSSRTPDYELTIDSQLIIVEVKEIVQNREEVESGFLLSERGHGNVLSNTPGDRVRKKITDGSSQIRARTKGIFPSILVLFDRGQFVSLLDPYNIRVAMYGLERIHIAKPRNPTLDPYVTGGSYGPKRKMTEKHNTAISALGVLFIPERHRIELSIYHNKYAAISLDPRLLAEYRIRQYRLQEIASNVAATWEEIIVNEH